jgi:hypothetical protein
MSWKAPVEFPTFSCEVLFLQCLLQEKKLDKDSSENIKQNAEYIHAEQRDFQRNTMTFSNVN